MAMFSLVSHDTIDEPWWMTASKESDAQACAPTGGYCYVASQVQLR